jgi:hypothetical protein
MFQKNNVFGSLHRVGNRYTLGPREQEFNLNPPVEANSADAKTRRRRICGLKAEQ